jgi:glycogen debranching enzyme
MGDRSAMSKLVLMDEETFLVSDESGDIAGQDPADGLYHRDMRHLEELRLALNGAPFEFLAAPESDSATAVVLLTNGPLTLPGGARVLPQTISLRRTRFLRGGLHERLELVSYNREPIPFRLELTLGGDFRDMFDIRGIARGQPGQLLAPRIDGDGALVLAYQGRDGVRRETLVRSQPAFADVQWSRVAEVDAAAVSLPDAGHVVDSAPRQTVRAHPTIEGVLEPQRPFVVSLLVETRASGERAPTPSYDAGAADEEGQLREWREHTVTRVACGDHALGRLLERSMLDLFLLTRWGETGPVPVAGIPWFACPFGRDSIITALETLILCPDLAVGTLRFLAGHQGRERNDRRDEEPGKIMHELRAGELANLGLIPQTPYYGSVDATPLFLMLLGETVAWLDDDGLLDELWPVAERALEWIEQCGDLDGDGLVEYLCRSPFGIRNQGWKDSDDSATHLDGRLAEPPVALIEVQAYCYAARRAMAALARRRGQADRAAGLDERAERLAAVARDRFWLPELGCYAEALDREKRPVAVASSNVAHALYCGLATPEHAATIAARLVEPDMLCGWGLRTLSSLAPSYNPMSYHNGSVWPHDNALAAAGLLRCDQAPAGLAVIGQVFRAAQGFRGQRLPELYCGFARGDEALRVPAAYPVSCSPQAWAAGAPYLMLRALLGLEPDPAGRRVCLRPRLPDWLPWVEIERMRCGLGAVSFRLARAGERHVLEQTAGDWAVEVVG